MTRSRPRAGRDALLVLGCLFAGAQAIRFERTNPPVTADLAAPPAVQSVLRRACYDCHSNETRWPWSAGLAPISWLVHYDVSEGRRRLNFSTWDDYASDPGTRLQKLKNLEKAMAEEDMPPWYYRMLHPDSKLSKPQHDLVFQWLAQELTDSRSSQ